jgi:hypothetical protein
MLVADVPLLRVLHADGPAPDRAAQMMLYGRFVGSWAGTMHYRDAEQVRRERPVDVHFGWVLEGRAVQDVWIAPSRTGHDAEAPVVMYGTTIRIYDPRRDLWEITWLNPVSGAINRMTGREVGADIVQEYRTDDGVRCQWMFTEITPGSFHWISRDSADEGRTWRVDVEMFLRRLEDSPA